MVYLTSDSFDDSDIVMTDTYKRKITLENRKQKNN